MSVASELAVRFTADTSGLDEGAKKAEGIVGRVTGGLGKLGLAGLGLGVIKSGIEGIAGAAQGLIAGNAEFERYETQLGTLMGSADAAKERLAELAEFGAKTPFELPEIARAEKVLLGFGLAGQKALDLTGRSAADLRTVIGDVAAGTGVAFEEVALTFGKFSSGATGEAIARLQELGVVTKEQMAEMGIQFSKSGELLSPLPEAFKVATDIAAEKFGGGMDALSNTFEGKLSTLSDTWGELKRTVAAPLFDVLKSALDALQPALVSVTAWLGENLPGAIATVSGIFGQFMGTLSNLYGRFVSFFTDTSAQGQSFKDKLLELWSNIKDAVARVVDWFNSNVKPILVGVFQVVRDKLAELKQQFDDKFGSIRGFVQSVVDWFNEHVAPTLKHVFDEVMAVIGPVVAFIRDHMDQIKAIVGGVIDVVVGVLRGGFAIVKGLFETVMAAIRGDWSGAWEAIKGIVAGVIPAVLKILGGLWSALRGLASMAFDAVLGIGGQIVDGIRAGIRAKWDAVLAWIGGLVEKIPAIARKALGIASPSKVFAAIGEQTVEGLRIGMAGLADLAGIINETLGRIIGDADRENFRSIAELTASLLDIFRNTTDAIKALLSFDITTSAEQISAAFDKLVGTFETALLRMKGLSQYAGRGESPDSFLNMFDVQNIEIVTKGFAATIDTIKGLLDIVEQMSRVKLPEDGAILRLIPLLGELSRAADQFVKGLGTPEGEDATAWFNQGATTAAAIAAWAKSIAEIVGLKIGNVAADFQAQMERAAAAAGMAWNAVKAVAVEWGGMGVTMREQMLTGVQAYATAVGAAIGLLKAAGELDFSKAVDVTDAQLARAAENARRAGERVGALATHWISWTAEFREKVLGGMKDYADAAGAALGLLQQAGDFKLDKATEADVGILSIAARNAKLAETLLRGLADGYTRLGEEWRATVVPALKDYADAAGAALDLLGKAGAFVLDIKEATKVKTLDALAAAGDLARQALGELTRLAGEYVGMAAEARGNLVAGIKDFADAAGAAVDLLVKGATGINALGEIKRLSGIQPRLIAAILGQLKATVDIVAANIPKVDEATAAKLAGFGALAGVFDPLAKAAEGMNALGAVKRLAGVQPRLIRAILAGVNVAVTEVAAGAGSFTTDAVAKVKAWGEASAATLGALTTAADGLNKMNGKLTIPDDLSARVAALVGAMRVVVDSMAGALADGAIRLDVAKAGADVAAAVGAIADAMGPVFDAINAAVSSPFGRIRATGQRGDTFRQNIANRVRASIVAAVTAISDALKELPTINVPDELVTQVDKLASVYERILDVVERLGEVKVDMRAVAALSAAMAALAGGVAAGAPGGSITVTASGSGTNLTVASGPGGGIQITNVYSPTVTPMPVTISTTNNINIGTRTVEAIATEVKILQELELRQGSTT